MMDLIVKNGTIVDGSKNSAFCGNIGIKKNRIVRLSSTFAQWPEAVEIIDARGLHVMPGFVDIHRHGDLVPFRNIGMGEEVRQGITTFVNGNCGFSAAPSKEPNCQLLADYSRPILGSIPPRLMPIDMQGFFREIQKGRFPSNMGYLVGGGALRIAVKGFDASPISNDQMKQVCELLEQSFDAGAMGLSMGLMYVPENFYKEKDLIHICKVAARKDRLVTVHMRGEGSNLVSSVEELIRIAKESGARLHISHLKAAGKKNWHVSVAKVLELIERAREEGVDLSFDVYPYFAGSTALYTLLPPTLLEGGIQKMMERLKDKGIRTRLAKELRREQPWDNLIASTGWERVVLAGGKTKDFVGKTLQQIADEGGVKPEICMMDLLLENYGDVPIVFHSMSQKDMEMILSYPDSIIISDGIYSEEGNPHPRRYGAFSRSVRLYQNQLGLETVIHKMTHLPAARIGLKDRGLIREGYYADLVMVDLEQYCDQATYQQPVQYPRGIKEVVLNGKKVLNKNSDIEGYYGRLLRL